MNRYLALLIGVLAVGCEYPTEAPAWDQTWVVPVDRIQVGVAELLPAGVNVNADSSEFLAQTPEASIQVDLATLCGTACVLASGLAAPKPEFGDTLTTSTSLPSGVVSATLAGGTVAGTLAHNFNFDPLRPSTDPGAPRGFIVIRVTSGGNMVAYDSIDGADQAFPSSVTLTPTLDIQPVQVTETVDIAIALYSPEGDTITVNASDTVGIRFAPATVRIAQATIEAANLAIDPVVTTLGFGSVDSATVERITGGALRFGVVNPFTISGTLDMAFRGSFPTFQHQLAIQAGTYAQRVEFSADQVREVLRAGQAEVQASGNATAPGGTLTIAPSDVMVLDSEFELSVLVGSQEALNP